MANVSGTNLTISYQHNPSIKVEVSTDNMKLARIKVEETRNPLLLNSLQAREFAKTLIQAADELDKIQIEGYTITAGEIKKV